MGDEGSFFNKCSATPRQHGEGFAESGSFVQTGGFVQDGGKVCFEAKVLEKACLGDQSFGGEVVRWADVPSDDGMLVTPERHRDVSGFDATPVKTKRQRKRERQRLRKFDFG